MPRNPSIHHQFIAVLLWASLGLVAAAALMGYRVSYDHAVAGARDSLQALAANASRPMASATVADDLELLDLLAHELHRHPLVARVVVQRKDGEMLVQLGSTLPGVEAQDATLSHRLSLPSDPAQSVATLRLTVDNHALREHALADALTLVMLLIVLVGGLATVYVVAAQRMVSAPLRTLAAQVASLQPGQASALPIAAAHQHDEIGAISAAVNQLLASHDAALTRERALRADAAALEAQYRQIFDLTSAGIFVLSPDGHLLTSTPPVAKLLMANARDMEGLRQADFVSTVFDDSARVFDMIERAAREQKTVARDLQLRCINGDRRWVHCLLSVHTQGGRELMVQSDGFEVKDLLIEGVFFDITQRKHNESVASHRAEHDPLTGLKNRAGIERELAHCLGLARTQDNHTTLLFIDLDGFKQVNDDYGHDVGDIVLIECAQRLKRLVRQEIDFVGRLGGDEMVLVLNGMEADSEVVGAMAQRVVRALSLPVVLAGGRQVHIGASVGVAGYPIHASNPTALIRVADAAMYRVKREGKNNFAVADSSLTLDSDMMTMDAPTSMRDAPTTV